MSNIKDRVLLIANEKGINKLEFFKDLDLSYANFKGVQKQSALSSDAVAKILAKHSEISPTWLVMGEGEMLSVNCNAEKPTSHQSISTISDEEQGAGALLNAMQRLVASLEQTISSQEKTISALEKQILLLEAELNRVKQN